MMRVAVPSWNGRVSPLLDTARLVHVLDVEGRVVYKRSDHEVGSANLLAFFWQLGVDVVICSAVSRELKADLWQVGVDVVSEIRGRVEEVVDAFLQDKLDLNISFSLCRAHRANRTDPGDDHEVNQSPIRAPAIDEEIEPPP